jgi:hypothetical protein
MLIVTVAVAAAIGFGTRAAEYVQALIHRQDVGRVAILFIAAMLAVVPLAFVLAVRLGQLAIWGPRGRSRKLQPGDEPLTDAGVSQSDEFDGRDR